MKTGTRREMLRRVMAVPWAGAGVQGKEGAVERKEGKAELRFGVIADVHQDVMPDGVERVGAFVRAMEEAGVDFVVQLGDFCVPHERNRGFMEVWNGYKGRRYSVLGNHDMDGGYTREQAAAFFGMPERRYGFEAGKWRGIVLDGNEPGGMARGYARYVSEGQLRWLEEQLAADRRPAFVFIHQPVDGENEGCVENGAAVRAVLEKAQRERPGVVAAVISGHRHLDYAREIGGVRYLEINSASYWWLNAKAAARETFPAEVHRRHPSLKSVAAYRDPLWAVVTVTEGGSELVVTGRSSEWVGPDPWERGETARWPREELHPGIGDRRFELRGKV
jgi:predicted phosphodiesterase